MDINEVKNDLIEDIREKIAEITGADMPGLKRVLTLLAHPDVVELTKEYVGLEDVRLRCQRYQDPWNCAREAEARYENIKYGWLGGVTGGYGDWWCDNCRAKATGGDE